MTNGRALPRIGDRVQYGLVTGRVEAITQFPTDGFALDIRPDSTSLRGAGNHRIVLVGNEVSKLVTLEAEPDFWTGAYALAADGFVYCRNSLGGWNRGGQKGEQVSFEFPLRPLRPLTIASSTRESG